MAKGKKGKPGKKAWWLGATASTTQESAKGEISRDKIGYAVLSFFGGAVIASALHNTPAGKFTGLAGIVAGGLGAWKKNLYATSFGAGMFFSAANFPKASAGTGAMGQIKENTQNYFKNLAGKLMLKSAEAPPAETPAPETTNGLNGEQEEVKYFINPYLQKKDELDLSALNNIEQQMEQAETGEDPESGEMNF